MTVRKGRRSQKLKPTADYPSVHVSNTHSPLIDTPAKDTTLLIGDSILQNIKLQTPLARVECIPGVRAAEFE